MTKIPDYIDKRIRQPIPSGLCVVPGSTPIVAFGDARTAKVATLGLNPSHREFQDKDGCELTGPQRRLATHNSLDVSGLVSAPPEVIDQVLDECNTYFKRNPYCTWFNQLDLVLNFCGASYYDGSACHLDLVQWATKPAWGSLNLPVKCRLLLADANFLREQLTNENIELLLVNGIEAADILQGAFCTKLEELCPVEVSGKRTKLFVGSILGRVRVIAWSAYIQRGVSHERKAALAERIAQLA